MSTVQPANPRLFYILEKIAGKGNVEIHRAGEEATFKIPAVTAKNLKVKQVNVEYWGEKYAINCPVCGDTKHRLEISYMLGQEVYMNKLKSPYKIKPFCYKCYNEGCNNTELVREITGMEVPATIPDIPIGRFKATKGAKPPKDFYVPEYVSLASPNVPESVLKYIAYRNFDPAYLENTFQVGYISDGTSFKNSAGDLVQFREDRLFIPVMHGERMIGWQTRMASSEKSKYKYINTPGISLKNYLYNIDNAALCDDIVIVEGVADVWRVGQNAVALFGKYASVEQIHAMQVLWGFNGRAVIMLDKDAASSAIALKEKLDAEGVFARGTTIVELDPAIGDPADHTKAQLDRILSSAFEPSSIEPISSVEDKIKIKIKSKEEKDDEGILLF